MDYDYLFFQLKMIRKGTKPPIWRRALVPSNITFAQMALILEEMLELPKSDRFEFEFYQKKDRLIEWHEEDADVHDYYYDYLNAPDTFVNEWMMTEKWFTFRIRGVSSQLPEYRVEIERFLKTVNIGSDLQPLTWPVITETKLPENDPYWPGANSGQINEHLHDFFQVKKGGAEYLYLAELIENIEGKQCGLKYCTELANRNIHSKEAPDKILKKLAEQIRENANILSGAKESDFQDTGDSTSEGNTSAREQMKEELPQFEKIPMPKQPRKRATVETGLKALTRENLLEMAESLEMQISGTQKNKIAYEIARYLLDPSNMRKELLLMSEEELDEFERLIESGFSKISEKAKEKLDALWNLGYVVAFRDGSYEVPEDAETVYQVIKRNGYREFHRQAVWMLKCLNAFSELYYVTPVKVLYRMYKRDRALAVPYADFLDLYEKIPEEMNPCCVIDDKIMLSHLAEDGRYKLFDMGQIGTEFYIPTKEEIECLSRDGYPSCVEEYQKLEAFLQNRVGLDEDRCSELCRSAYHMFSSDGEPSDFVIVLENKKIRFATRKDSENFDDLLTQAYLHTWKIELLGHTIMEISQPTASVTVSSKVAASESSNVSFASESTGKAIKKTEPAKKIYPNDPCPCGSGKKYKKCCGRKV
ncbi:MAG: SEC-C domain-containing protein [Lachnospiraceae bacterium]|nr:SEC-C domain-containing protein [Lachnospiraceae bacterium]